MEKWEKSQTTNYLANKDLFVNFFNNIKNPNRKLKIRKIKNRIICKQYNQVEYLNIAIGKKVTKYNEDCVLLDVRDWTYNHYGHFMVDVMNRMWYLQDEKYKKMKIICCLEDYSYLFEWFYLLGIQKEQIILIKEGEYYKFKSIYVPEQSMGSLYGTNNLHYNFVKTFNEISKNVSDKYNYEKIFISRKKIVGSGLHKNICDNIFGEHKIAKIFEKNGYKIIYPEDYSLIEQVQLFKKCKVLASIGGSGLHNSVFLPDKSEVVCLFRDYHYTSFSCQCAIDFLKGHTTNYIDASINPFSYIYGTIPACSNCIVGVNQFVKNFFDDKGFVYKLKDLEVNKEEFLQYIIDFGKRYGMERKANRPKSRIPKFLVMMMCAVMFNKRKRHQFRKKFF
ncbi:MAG: glycosyltransferase family 61 protein [Rickettsiales bacterium]|jgi:hypothetical protein|nr:glycosyltransferase family 61 protein [Rickettsiales bacterium]